LVSVVNSLPVVSTVHHIVGSSTCVFNSVSGSRSTSLPGKTELSISSSSNGRLALANRGSLVGGRSISNRFRLRASGASISRYLECV